MKKIMIFLLLIVASFVVTALEKDFDLQINYTTRDNRINISTEDRLFENIDCSIDEEYERTITITRSFNETGSEINNLTKALIINQGNILNAFADYTKNTTALSKEYVDCVDGRARTAAIHDNTRQERDLYHNQSVTCTEKYQDLKDEDEKTKSSNDQLEGQVSNIRTERNNLEQQKNDAEKKATTYLIGGIIIGWLLNNNIGKKKDPKPSEGIQFGPRN